MDVPSKMSNKRKNQSNRVHICNMDKGFTVADAFLLRKSLHNQVIFVMLENTFRGKFGFGDPSTLHNVLPFRSGN